jgi:hypothetical protein
MRRRWATTTAPQPESPPRPTRPWSGSAPVTTAGGHRPERAPMASCSEPGGSGTHPHDPADTRPHDLLHDLRAAPDAGFRLVAGHPHGLSVCWSPVAASRPVNPAACTCTLARRSSASSAASWWSESPTSGAPAARVTWPSFRPTPSTASGSSPTPSWRSSPSSTSGPSFQSNRLMAPAASLRSTRHRHGTTRRPGWRVHP